MRPARSHVVLRWGRAPQSDLVTASVVSTLTAGGFLLVAAGWGWWTGPSVVGLLVGLTVFVMPQHVVVGDDGVLLPRGRFVSFSELADLRSFDRGLTLELRSGDVIDLVTSRNAHPFSRRDPTRDALLADLGARRREWEDQGDLEEVPALARSTLPALEWVAALRALGDGEGGYRAAGVARERLWALARSPRTPEGTRAAAIVALGPSLDAAERRVLRDLAASCASPRVRAVAGAVADARADDAIARALTA